MTKQQKVSIRIPKEFSPAVRKEIAKDVIDFIIKRTREDQLDKNNKKFKAYTKEYALKKGVYRSDVDLTDTSDMLDELQYLNDKSGEITIGYKKGDEINGKVEGNRIGSYGGDPNPAKARDFLGIAEEDLNKILSKYEDEPRRRETREVSATDEELIDFLAEELINEISFELDNE